MAAQLPRPGVEIVQEFRSTSPTIVTPTLVPCNVAPFFEIIEVLKSDGTLNADSKLTDSYRQLGLTVNQSSFPSPRGNIDEVNVDEDSIRWFFNFGGTLVELSRTSGYLADLNLATQPSVTGSTTGPFNLNGKKLVVQFDSHTQVGGANPTAAYLPASANVQIEFEADAMTIDEVVAFVNSKVPNVASDDGGGQLKLTSTKYGAKASAVVRATGSANTALGFSVLKDQVAVGAGFYAIDDGDSDSTTPRIEFFTGTTQRDVDVANVPVLSAPNFNDYFITAGDEIVADGVLIGEILQVFADRLVVAVEQNLFGVTGLVPFSPRYFWVQAQNLTYPPPVSTVAAVMTGTVQAADATQAFIVAQAAGTYPVGPGESFDVDITIAGVAQPTEVIGTGAGWASLAAAITAINAASTNFEAYAANTVGDEVPVAIGQRLALRTLASNTGSAAVITLADQSGGMTVGFSALPVADVGENIRFMNGSPAKKVDGAAWTGGTGATSGEAFVYTPTVNGVAKPAETITWSASHAATGPGLLAAIADWNTQALYTEAYESNAAGVETVGGNRFAIRTRGENVGTDAIINMTAIDTPTGNHLTVASAAGSSTDLNGKSFKWQMDKNPKTYQVLFVTDEDDGGVSLASIIAKINELTPLVASESASAPPALMLTSGLAGEASSVKVIDGTANVILGFTDNAEELGDGRPAPDLAVDISGNVVIQHQILRDGLTGLPFATGSAQMHAAYKALRLDVSPDANEPSLLVFNSTTVLEQLANPISTANPGALMCFLSLLNSPGTSVAAIGVPEVSADAPEGTPIGYAKCAEFLESEEVYAIALGTQLSVIHQAFLTHVGFMSEPEQKGERILFFNPTQPTRRVPTLVGSGTDANSTPTAGKMTVEVNLAPALIDLGLDPANINPTSGAIVNAVYLDLGSDDGAYLVQRVENGTDVFLRKDFVTGDGNEDAFYATVFPSGIISDDWSLSVRGTKLLLPSSTLPDKDGIAETVQAQALAIKNRRGFYVVPDQCGINVTGLEQLVPGYYATACIVGMVANLPPQQGFTNYPIAGLTRVVGSNDKFSNKQLNVMAAGGTYILVQDAQGAPIVCRHQLSTDLSSIETRELSITKVVDFTAKFLRVGLRNFIGRANITQAFLDQLSSVVQGLLSFLTEGGVLIGADINNLIQDADSPDTVLVDITLDVPYPCNFIRVTLVI